MNEVLRERIFANQFGLNVLEQTLDRESFLELRSLFREVAEEWRDLEAVDKRVVNYMVELLMITHNKLQYGGFDSDDAAELARMHDELQRIILEECLLVQV